MKKILFCLAMLSLVLLAASCSGKKTYAQNADGFEALGEDLKAKFGAQAWYTDLGISYTDDGQVVMSVTETDDPSSLKMRKWVMSAGQWRQTADVTMEIEGATPETFMFQLGTDVDMRKVGTLIEQSKAKLTAEKNIDNPRVDMVSMHTPDDEDKSTMYIFIVLQPENGGTDFRFYYNLDGQLVKFNY